MKLFLITTLLMVCQYMQAQESTETSSTFTRSYTLFQLSNGDLDNWQEIKKGKTIFIFNKGADEHTEWIFNGTKTNIYRTSNVKRDSIDNGELYQAFEAVTEKGGRSDVFPF